MTALLATLLAQPALVPMHMGALHPYEKALTLVLAFGPFVVLGAVIVHRRRQDEREEQAAPTGQTVQTGEVAREPLEGQRER